MAQLCRGKRGDDVLREAGGEDRTGVINGMALLSLWELFFCLLGERIEIKSQFLVVLCLFTGPFVTVVFWGVQHLVQVTSPGHGSQQDLPRCVSCRVCGGGSGVPNEGTAQREILICCHAEALTKAGARISGLYIMQHFPLRLHNDAISVQVVHTERDGKPGVKAARAALCAGRERRLPRLCTGR